MGTFVLHADPVVLGVSPETTEGLSVGLSKESRVLAALRPTYVLLYCVIRPSHFGVGS